ncbi:hypothetical protein L2E82_30802 [Cichorium intybus]|uniref:Uncharacterized protein n=1 Tax=Cichorium intybus TaxID=13427 RepID=A0ACB9D1D6_CICIN|nr:hypothetical protein L2E82_30802 [Cichorium intybus]
MIGYQFSGGGFTICTNDDSIRREIEEGVNEEDELDVETEEADYGIQSVNDVDLKPKAKVAIRDESDKMDTVEVKSEGLEEEIKSKKDKEDNRKVKAEDLQEKTTSSRQSMSNSKIGTSVRQAKSDAVSKWIPSNKGSYMDSMHIYYPPTATRHVSAPPVLAQSEDPRLGEKKSVGKGGHASGKQASCPPSLSIYGYNYNNPYLLFVSGHHYSAFLHRLPPALLLSPTRYLILFHHKTEGIVAEKGLVDLKIHR